MRLGDRVVVASVDHHLFYRFRLRFRLDLPDNFVAEKVKQSVHAGVKTAKFFRVAFQQKRKVKK
jgi:hypothetical protein